MGGRRYQDLHDALDGIAHKVLTETWRRAERDGLIARHLDTERIEPRPTPNGQAPRRLRRQRHRCDHLESRAGPHRQRCPLGRGTPRAVDAHPAEWQEILETATRFATNCAKAYARAWVQTRRRFNQAVFIRIEVSDAKIAGVGT
jgi:hypothetical protein